jgi:hypothetical protein
MWECCAATLGRAEPRLGAAGRRGDSPRRHVPDAREAQCAAGTRGRTAAERDMMKAPAGACQPASTGPWCDGERATLLQEEAPARSVDPYSRRRHCWILANATCWRPSEALARTKTPPIRRAISHPTRADSHRRPPLHLRRTSSCGHRKCGSGGPASATGCDATMDNAAPGRLAGHAIEWSRASIAATRTEGGKATRHATPPVPRSRARPVNRMVAIRRELPETC